MSRTTTITDIEKIIQRYFPDGKGLRSNDKHVRCMYAILKELEMESMDYKKMDGMSALQKK